MSTAAALALVTALLSAMPELIRDVELLVADLKKGADVRPAPLAPEMHAAMDELLAKLKAGAAVK